MKSASKQLETHYSLRNAINLKTQQIIIKKNIQKLYVPYLLDTIQLSEEFRATTRRKFTFNYSG